jgi:hypothetical protein
VSLLFSCPAIHQIIHDLKFVHRQKMYNEFMPNMMMELQIIQTILCFLLPNDTSFYNQVITQPHRASFLKVNGKGS